MPIHEYQCNDCGHCFEKLSFATDPETSFKCPECGSDKTQKLMSCASFMGGGKSGFCSTGSTGGFS